MQLKYYCYIFQQSSSDFKGEAWQDYVDFIPKLSSFLFCGFLLVFTMQFQFSIRLDGDAIWAGRGGDKHPDRKDPIYVDEAVISIPEIPWQLHQWFSGPTGLFPGAIN